MKADTLQWEYCPISSTELHTQYRGMDVHKWKDFYCFYPTEGEATEAELNELRSRIEALHIQVGGKTVSYHSWSLENGKCALKQRNDGITRNYCLQRATIEELDMILDALYEQAGLVKATQPVGVGRWR